MTLKPMGFSIMSQDKTTIPKRVRNILNIPDGTYILYELDSESKKIIISRS